MAYSNFTLSKFKKSFSIRIDEETNLCVNIKPLHPRVFEVRTKRYIY